MLAKRVDVGRAKDLLLLLPLMLPLMLLPDSGFARSHVYGAATKVIKPETEKLRENEMRD